MISPEVDKAASRLGAYGALTSMTAIVLSGPPGALLVARTHPQPAWVNAAVFSEHYHYLQAVPYYFDLLLVVGFLLVIVAVYAGADEQQKPSATAALAFSIIFAVLISFNYIVQTTYIPALTWRYRPELAGTIATLSMGNPLSLCWVIEMWGYAFLGIATWFAASAFQRNRLEAVTGKLFVCNGVISVAGAFITSINLGWVISLAGLVSYVFWNVLMFASAVLVFVAFKSRRMASSTRTQRPLAADLGRSASN